MDDVPVGKPLQVSDEPDPDGTQWLRVEIPGFGEAEIAFPEDIAVEFVAAFQQGFFERRLKMAAPPHYPVLQVTKVYLGHGPGGDSGLMVETYENATLALMATPEMLALMQSQIGQLLDAIRQKSQPH